MLIRDDVAEFAALLRRLKDRTDRSYGSLARRIHMNTSTLHRYCAGEAVPQDFAPVERLAAFCGATPEERLELHRLWLSAVAARQRVRTAGSAEAAVPLMEPDEGGALVEESSSAEQPRDDDPDPDGPAPTPAPRSWFGRRQVLTSTAVACALLATLGITTALSDDHSSKTDATRSEGRPTTAAGAPHRSAEPSATTSRSPDQGSASPGSRPPSTAPSATGSDPTSTAKSTTGLPLAWNTDSLVWDKGCDHEYVIDKPPAQVPPPPVEQDAGAWAARQGAVHGGQTKVQISVQGRSSTAVVLEALRVRIVSRGNPAAGNAYDMSQGCGGEVMPRRFTVNLDVDRPIARPKDGSESQHTIPAAHLPLRVSAEDPEVLLVDATTQTYDTRWYLELDWSSQGRTGTIRIDDHGRPFHTTSIKGRPHYWYGTNDAGGRAWVVPYGG
ncbi:helix-turn-helix domain-containing protein [Streptomyces sp. NPDC058691]|uniref:helix-turn-helix domain-containing protein n=1 Tax=Streptomyces sp. NPDC058691 TaxID=3346601 RepID=UPI00364EDE54